MDKIEADAVVVGAGIAGLVTALRLAEQGMKAVVLEQGSQDKYPVSYTHLTLPTIYSV